jgi:hypothetical protein
MTDQYVHTLPMLPATDHQPLHRHQWRAFVPGSHDGRSAQRIRLRILCATAAFGNLRFGVT